MRFFFIFLRHLFMLRTFLASENLNITGVNDVIALLKAKLAGTLNLNYRRALLAIMFIWNKLIYKKKYFDNFFR